MTNLDPSPDTPRCPRCGWHPIGVLFTMQDLDAPPAERWWVYIHCGGCRHGVGMDATGPTTEAAEEAARRKWVTAYPPKQEPA